jgi:AraC family transcriptional regulator
MRSEYSRIPPGEGAGRTEPNQIGVSFTHHRAAVYESDGRTVESDIAAGSVFVTGTETITWTRVRETTEALEIFPDLELLHTLALEIPELEPARATRDGTVLAISTVLKRVHATGSTLSDIVASTLAHRLAVHLLEQYCGAPRQLREHPGRLERSTVDRVTEFVDAELTGELTLDRIAAAATMSPFHFARTFKHTTGIAPHQFVMARRMERAAALLRSGMSVLDTAHAVGLSNVSHFRRVFRRHHGVLPGEVNHPSSEPTRLGRTADSN